MPFDNFENRHFSSAEITAITNALTALEAVLTGKLANLSPEERTQFGSINEQNKLIVNKIKDFREAQPLLASPDVDWVEFMNDYKSRSFLEGILLRMAGLMSGLESAKILHDWDNYQASLTDYDYTKYKASTKATGFEVKLNEIKQFFPRTGQNNKE